MNPHEPFPATHMTVMSMNMTIVLVAYMCTTTSDVGMVGTLNMKT